MYVIDKRGVVETRQILALVPLHLSVIALSETFREHKFSQYCFKTSWPALRHRNIGLVQI